MNYLRRNEAANYLQENYGIGSVGSLATMAVRGGGPKFYYLGRWPLYTPADLDSWAQSRLSRPVTFTAELAGERTA